MSKKKNGQSKTIYNCKDNDVMITVFSEDGKIDELHIGFQDGGGGATVVGYIDLINAIQAAHVYNSKWFEEVTEIPENLFKH
jgi:hypothetical protein